MMTSNPFNFEIQSLTASNFLGLLLLFKFQCHISLSVLFFWLPSNYRIHPLNPSQIPFSHNLIFFFFLKPGLVLDLSLSLTTHTQPSTGFVDFASKCIQPLSCFLFSLLPPLPELGDKALGTCYPSQGWTPDTSVHCISVSELPRQAKRSQALDGIVLYSDKQVGSVSPWPGGPQKAGTGQLVCLHPSVPQQKILQTLAVEFEILKTGNVPKDQ